MRSGPMPTSTFERLVANNIYDKWGGFKIERTRWGVRKGLAPHMATLVIGDYHAGNSLNVTAPDIPEHTELRRIWVEDDLGDGSHSQYDDVVAEGWRILLDNLVRDGTLRLGEDIKQWLPREQIVNLEEVLSMQGRL